MSLAQIDRSKAKILVVDDQRNAVDALTSIFSAAGYTNVTSTTDPCTVKSLYVAHEYDLILLDMLMPGLDGMALMRSLSTIERYGYLPVIAVTGSRSLQIEALTGGARDFILKPYDRIELETRSRNFIEMRLLHKHVTDEATLNRSLAMHDGLTGLPNRRLLEDRLGRAIEQAQRSGNMVGIMYIDLDGFKRINDTYGHAIGDEVLKLAARRFVASLRAEDTVARVSGDEFVIVLQKLSGAADSEFTAKKILSAFAAPFETNGLTLNLSASIGLSVFPRDGTRSSALIGHADAALYVAKRSGKNRYAISGHDAV